MNQTSSYPNEESAKDPGLSRTKRKQQVEELQRLGVKLVKTTTDKLRKLNLPPLLYEAIIFAQKINSNGALRRQYQYIGKLMRSVDAESIYQQLEYLNGNLVKYNQIFHLAERWRDKLLATDDSLSQFVAEYPGAPITMLRTLIRQVRKEQQFDHKRNYTKLFRIIRSIIEENHS